MLRKFADLARLKRGLTAPSFGVVSSTGYPLSTLQAVATSEASKSLAWAVLLLGCRNIEVELPPWYKQPSET